MQEKNMSAEDYIFCYKWGEKEKICIKEKSARCRFTGLFLDISPINEIFLLVESTKLPEHLCQHFVHLALRFTLHYISCHLADAFIQSDLQQVHST